MAFPTRRFAIEMEMRAWPFPFNGPNRCGFCGRIFYSVRWLSLLLKMTHRVLYVPCVFVCVCVSSSAKPPQYTCWDDCQSVSYQKTRCYRIRRTGKLNEIIVFRTLQMNRLRDTGYVMYNAMYICIFSYKKYMRASSAQKTCVSIRKNE